MCTWITCMAKKLMWWTAWSLHTLHGQLHYAASRLLLCTMLLTCLLLPLPPSSFPSSPSPHHLARSPSPSLLPLPPSSLPSHHLLTISLVVLVTVAAAKPCDTAKREPGGGWRMAPGSNHGACEGAAAVECCPAGGSACKRQAAQCDGGRGGSGRSGRSGRSCSSSNRW